MTTAEMSATARVDVGAALKPAESWWVVLVIDPIVVRLLPALLRRRWLTPNMVTACAFLVGVIAVAGFALGHWRLGAVLFEIRFLLDCIDGKIARCRRLSSVRGAAFDRVADFLSIPSLYAAIGLQLAAQGALPSELALLPALACALTFVVELALDATRRGHRPTSTFASHIETGDGFVGWMRRHRLTLRPWTVEAEAVGLFLAPLLLAGHALATAEIVIAAIYLAFVCVDIALITRDAIAADRTAPEGSAP